VPALFQQWTSRVIAAAGIQPGQRVLDVVCGTGALTRAAAVQIGPTGKAIGLDVSAGMLAVAARLAPEIAWWQGAAESLPFDTASFDAVVSQFGLMFFANQAAGLQEMMRVLAPGGYLAVAVWDTLDRTPGYAALVALLQRLFGEHAADALRAPFALGEARTLSALLTGAGIPAPEIATQVGTARFPSIRSWIYTDVKGWSPLGTQLDAGQFEVLTAEAERPLRAFVTANGTVEFPMPAHIVTARKA